MSVFLAYYPCALNFTAPKILTEFELTEKQKRENRKL